MSRWIFMSRCFVLALVVNCKAALASQEPNDRSIEAPIAAHSNRSVTQTATTAAMDPRNKNDTDVDFLCANRSCLSLCCPIGSFAVLSETRNCTAAENTSIPGFPFVRDYRTLEPLTKPLDIRDFNVVTRNPCRETGRDWFYFTPDVNSDDAYQLLTNGSVYVSTVERIIDFTDYCLRAVDNSSVYRIVLCNTDEFRYDDAEIFISVDPAFLAAMIIAVPFLLVTFVVYSIVPELRTIHGATLRGYVGPLIVAYTTETILVTSATGKIGIARCMFLGFVIHTSYLASFFWLNVMCFDIWWTFGNFRSPPSNVNQRDRKKFIMYSAYAWGSPTLISGVGVMMNFMPGVDGSYIGLSFGGIACWHYTEAARPIYFDAPIGLTVVCNICFFVLMALKMVKHNRDTAHHLKGTDSRRHDDSKQRFNIYFKLFILMGVSWSMEVIGRLCDIKHPELWAITNFINTLQSIIIFVTFVCKEKIKRLLLKRLGCGDRSIRPGSALRSTISGTFSTDAAVPTGSIELESD